MPERRTDWFAEAKFGVFLHYLPATVFEMVRGKRLPACSEWQGRVDALDVDRLASDLASTGARYVFITIGQSSGFYCSPNTAYASIVGAEASGKLSRRDLVADLAGAAASHGLRTLVYLPAHGPAMDLAAMRALSCLPPWDASAWQMPPGSYAPDPTSDSRLTCFQRHWEAVVREWSLRWGRRVGGWWIDGCYYGPQMYGFDDAPNYASFAAAMRVGNPDSIVAFNPGVRETIRPLTEHEDYTAGEICWQLPVPTARHPISRFVDGKQYHLLGFLGQYWRVGAPRFSNALAASYTRLIVEHGGVVTWDVPIDDEGRIPGEFLTQLSSIGQAIHA